MWIIRVWITSHLDLLGSWLNRLNCENKNVFDIVIRKWSLLKWMLLKSRCFLQFLWSILFEIEKKIKRGIFFPFSSKIECNRRQINNYKRQVSKNDVFRAQCSRRGNMVVKWLKSFISKSKLKFCTNTSTKDTHQIPKKKVRYLSLSL